MTLGKFIAVEGVDMAGKSTLINWMSSILTDYRVDHICTREPGGTVIGDKIRTILLEEDHGQMTPWAEACLLSAGRSIHLKNKILPALADGKVVISDRYVLSSLAYQGLGRGIKLSDLNMLHRLACEDYMPDFTIILDVDPEVAMKRREEAGMDRIEQAGLDFQKRVREFYLDWAKVFTDHRTIVLDASVDAENVQAQLLPFLMELNNSLRKRPSI